MKTLYVVGRFLGMFALVFLWLGVIMGAFALGLWVLNSGLSPILKAAIYIGIFAFGVATWFAYDVATGKVER